MDGGWDGRGDVTATAGKTAADVLHKAEAELLAAGIADVEAGHVGEQGLLRDEFGGAGCGCGLRVGGEIGVL